MHSGCGELERATATLLTANVGEIRQRHAVDRHVVRRRGRELLLATQVGDGLGQVADADRLDARERRLVRRLCGAEDALEARTSRTLGGRDRPRDGSDPPVEAELTDAGVLGEPIARELLRRREHRQRDREIESGSLLPERGRRKIDRDRLARPLEERRVDAAPHAVLCLLAGPVGQPDDREGRLLARAQVRFDLDATRLETDEGERDRAAEHLPTLRLER